MIEPVTVDIEIPAPPEAVWSYLTVGELIGRWFADCAGLHARGRFRFEFGDGDYFVGEVTDWQEARALGLTWRFMGIGPTYEIRIELAPCALGTRVAVSDRGATSAEEARSLREGWMDFLTRLVQSMSTGRVTRYEWSDAISATALVGPDDAQVIAMVSEVPWWGARFPGAAARQAIGGSTA